MAALSLAAVLGLQSCGKSKPRTEPFDCEALQKRAERCEGEILEIVRRGYEVEKVTAGATSMDAEQGFRMFKIRFQRKLRQRNIERECRELAHPRDQAQHKRASALRFCYSRPTCKSFGECLLSQ
jgi:hypothetical protein